MAKRKATGEKRWRTVMRRKDGVAVLRSPDGREWIGTAAEVRAAAMNPWRRRMLADGLRVTRLTTDPRTAERAWIAAERRRWAIQESEADTALGHGYGEDLPADLALMAGAAARFAGLCFDEWVATWVRAGLDAEIDEAVGCGLDGLPLTRHERAALKRLGWKGWDKGVLKSNAVKG